MMRSMFEIHPDDSKVIKEAKEILSSSREISERDLNATSKAFLSLRRTFAWELLRDDVVINWSRYGIQGME